MFSTIPQQIIMSKNQMLRKALSDSYKKVSEKVFRLSDLECGTLAEYLIWWVQDFRRIDESEESEFTSFTFVELN